MAGHPLVVFSHGLFGCKEMYTNLARNLASEGKIVVCIEHEDGSACFHVDKEGKEGRYQKPPEGINYSNRDEVRAFRRPMLEKRAREVEAVLYALGVSRSGGNKGGEDSELPPPPPSSDSPLFMGDEEEILKALRKAINRDNVHLMGHSFGGASMIHATERVEELLGKSLKSRVLLDTWPYPLSEDVFSREYTLRSLFIESEEYEGKEVALTKELAQRGHAHLPI